MGLPHTDHHLHVPVLDGLGLLNAQAAKDWLAEHPKLRANARRSARALATEYRLAARQALPHRAFLQSLHEPA